MEQWRDIPGYEGIYQASDCGNIRTHADKTTTSTRHGIRHWKQRVLKQKCFKNRKGRIDARVTLWKDKKPHDYLVSRLVAYAWCPGYFDGATVNHKDGNPLNNNTANLEWVAHADNIRLGFETGLYSTQTACALIDEHGKQHAFRSLSVASCFLGRSHGYLSGRIKKGAETVTADNGAKYIIQGV